MLITQDFLIDNLNIKIVSLNKKNFSVTISRIWKKINKNSIHFEKFLKDCSMIKKKIFQ